MTFKNNLREQMLNMVWQQWCRLGVAGSARADSLNIIDPEPLLAFTSEIGRYDARLFDEVLDWLTINGSWINTQRLATIMKKDQVGCQESIGAMAAWMTSHDTSMKWRGVAKRCKPSGPTTEELLFRAGSANRIKNIEQPEVTFLDYGLVREEVQTRGMTQPIRMTDPGNILFRSRALFGINIRADVFAYLLTVDSGHARGISQILGFNHSRVQSVLTSLADADFIKARSNGKAKSYRIDRDRWCPVMFSDQQPPPRWISWRALIRGLTIIWREMCSLDEERADEYIRSSKMRGAMRAARNDLQESGIKVDILNDKNYVAEAYLPIFEQNISSLLKAISQ
jgi:hypothetical protein